MVRLVVGCGYLGLRVARTWQNAGDTVFAISRSSDTADSFQKQGIHPIVADITEPSSLDQLPDVDTLLFSVGFDRSRYKDVREVYVNGFKNVLDTMADRAKQLIYIGTTGVYGSSDGQWVNESSPFAPGRASSAATLEAEKLLATSSWQQKSTVLRLGGIYGPGRIPRLASIRSRQFDDLTPHGFINLIHVDDAAAIIDRVAEKQIVGRTFLVTDGAPPLRRDFYQFIAQQIGMGPIEWSAGQADSESTSSLANKRISNQKLMRELEIELKYPNYQSGVKDALKRTS